MLAQGRRVLMMMGSLVAGTGCEWFGPVDPVEPVTQTYIKPSFEESVGATGTNTADPGIQNAKALCDLNYDFYPEYGPGSEVTVTFEDGNAYDIFADLRRCYTNLSGTTYISPQGVGICASLRQPYENMAKCLFTIKNKEYTQLEVLTAQAPLLREIDQGILVIAKRYDYDSDGNGFLDDYYLEPVGGYSDDDDFDWFDIGDLFGDDDNQGRYCRSNDLPTNYDARQLIEQLPTCETYVRNQESSQDLEVIRLMASLGSPVEASQPEGKSIQPGARDGNTEVAVLSWGEGHAALNEQAYLTVVESAAQAAGLSVEDYLRLILETVRSNSPAKSNAN